MKTVKAEITAHRTGADRYYDVYIEAECPEIDCDWQFWEQGEMPLHDTEIVFCPECNKEFKIKW